MATASISPLACVLKELQLHPEQSTDAFVLYQALCAKTGKRQDPCVLDTFMAVTDFMRGGAAAPWWAYTPQRKLLYGQILPA